MNFPANRQPCRDRRREGAESPQQPAVPPPCPHLSCCFWAPEGPLGPRATTSPRDVRGGEEAEKAQGEGWAPAASLIGELH